MFSESLTENVKELKAKTQEEIDRATLDENMPPIDRAVYLLCSGEDNQKISVCNDLPNLIQKYPDECVKRIMPKLIQILPIAPVDIQFSTTKSFQQISQTKSLKQSLLTEQIVVPSLNILENNKDHEMKKLWLECVIEIISHNPSDPILHDTVLRRSMTLASSSSSLSRPIACHLLVRLCRVMDKNIVLTKIIPILQSLAQDVDRDTRALVCSRLHTVCEAVGPQQVLIDLVLELTSDEESCVQIASLETIAGMLPFLPKDLLKLGEEPDSRSLTRRVFTMVQSTVQSNSHSIASVAKYVAVFLSQLDEFLTPEMRSELLDTFRYLCTFTGTNDALLKAMPAALSRTAYTAPDVESRAALTRANAAGTFHLVTRLHTKLDPMLKPTLLALLQDLQASVRSEIVKNLSSIFGQDPSGLLEFVKPYAALLEDQAIEVVDAAVSCLSDMLSLIHASGLRIPCPVGSTPESKLKHQSAEALLAALIRCDHLTADTLKWRTQETLALAWPGLQCIASQDVLQTRILPLIFTRLMQARPLPVRKACIRSTLQITRRLRSDAHRVANMERLASELGQAKSSFTRSLYLESTEIAMSICSSRYVKTYMFKQTLALAGDPVCSLRLRVGLLLPKLKKTLVLPQDKEYFSLIESAIRTLKIREDRKCGLDQIVDELDRIVVWAGTTPQRSQPTAEDQRKQAEEEEACPGTATTAPAQLSTDKNATLKAKLSAKNVNALGRSKAVGPTSNKPANTLSKDAAPTESNLPTHRRNSMGGFLRKGGPTVDPHQISSPSNLSDHRKTGRHDSEDGIVTARPARPRTTILKHPASTNSTPPTSKSSLAATQKHHP